MCVGIRDTLYHSVSFLCREIIVSLVPWSQPYKQLAPLQPRQVAATPYTSTTLSPTPNSRPQAPWKTPLKVNTLKSRPRTLWTMARSRPRTPTWTWTIVMQLIAPLRLSPPHQWTPFTSHPWLPQTTPGDTANAGGCFYQNPFNGLIVNKSLSCHDRECGWE